MAKNEKKKIDVLIVDEALAKEDDKIYKLINFFFVLNISIFAFVY